MSQTTSTDYGRLTQQLRRAEQSVRGGRRQHVPLSALRQGHQEIDRLLTTMAADAADAARAGTVPALGIGSWTAEAARRRNALDRHRFAVADVAGLLLPTTVQPGSLAATGPYIAGMGSDPAEPLVQCDGRPPIGIELADVMDAVSGSPRTLPAGMATVPAHQPRP